MAIEDEPKDSWMPTRKDMEVIHIPGEKPLEFGFVCHILSHGDKYDETLGKQQEFDWVGNMDTPHGIYTKVEILEFLKGRVYNNLAWNWIIAMRPAGVILSLGMSDMICRTNWITVWVEDKNLAKDEYRFDKEYKPNKDTIIKRITMEVNPGQIGVHNGHDLHLATF